MMVKPMHAKHISNSIRKSLSIAEMNATVRSPVEAAHDFIRDMIALVDRIEKSLEN